MSGQNRWAGDGLSEAWYNKPGEWYDSAKRGVVSAAGGFNRDQLNATRTNAIKMGYKSGVKQGENALRDESFGKSLERTVGKGFRAGGEKIGQAGEYISDKSKVMSKGLRQGMDDNPAGMAAAAGGALLGGWALSKLRKKRQQAPG